MKKLICALSLAVLLAGSVAHAGVEWSTASFDQILSQAKQENRHVIIDFYATWCGPCKRLDEVTYQDANVIEFLNSNIPVKYDAEKGVGEELAGKYRIVAYPTLLVIAPDGKVIDRHIGYLEPEPFIGKMKDYINGVGTITDLEKQLKEKPDDVALLLEVGMKHADAVRAEAAEKCLNKVLELDPEGKVADRGEVFYALGDANYYAKRYPQAREYLSQAIEYALDEKSSETALRRLAYVEHKLGNSDAAVATYEKYLAKHPEDPRAMNGFAWFCAQRKIGLDKALPVAVKAAELSGRDPGILDTLAEVYYARGEFDRAIEIGKEALAKDPDDQYLKDQVEKFTKAKEEADAQARS